MDMIRNHQELCVCVCVCVCVFHAYHGTYPLTDYSSTHQILKRWCELLIPINVCRSELSAGRGGANESGLNGQLSSTVEPQIHSCCTEVLKLAVIINPVMIIKRDHVTIWPASDLLYSLYFPQSVEVFMVFQKQELIQIHPIPAISVRGCMFFFQILKAFPHKIVWFPANFTNHLCLPR